MTVGVLANSDEVVVDCVVVLEASTSELVVLSVSSLTSVIALARAVVLAEQDSLDDELLSELGVVEVVCEVSASPSLSSLLPPSSSSPPPPFPEPLSGLSSPPCHHYNQ